MIKANDTDILVLALSIFPSLQNLGLQQLWVAFGHGVPCGGPRADFLILDRDASIQLPGYVAPNATLADCQAGRHWLTFLIVFIMTRQGTRSQSQV